LLSKDDLNWLVAKARGLSVSETQVLYLEQLVKIQIAFLSRFADTMNTVAPGQGKLFSDEAKDLHDLLNMVMNPPR